ncbi:uncharacterized protein [Procambarus clarkii]|uniref:uncharacterized protein n=1 Tax=Procambarus clarkii TaxID=6728 RepID=UPI001E674FB3|nr:uncharacterized protein LOC123755069 isoform X2 [Procambarus clarkii]XP_045593500.1 uncharacterized protein LOC123755069 isoform X2 [Procambarus clarkii]
MRCRCWWMIMDDVNTSTTLLALLALLASCTEVVEGLHITKVHVPTPVAVGEGGVLECEFVDEGESIYALKWYLGLDEFYRWTPAETPQVKTFPVRGDPLAVDTGASHRGRVKVYDVTLGASGVFRCEVSAEAPDFHTESDVATMVVVDLPDEDPRLSRSSLSHQLHEAVSVNCSSTRSQPPAALTFYVNQELADPGWLIPYPPQEDPETGLETAVLGLRFPLRPRLLQGGAVSVKCTASIFDLYWASTEALIPADLPYHASIMEGRAAAGRGWCARVSNLARVLTASVLLLTL